MSQAPRAHPITARPVPPRPIPTRPIYVGYLPLPPRHRAFLRLTIPALALAMLALSALIAATHRNAGHGVWATEVSTITGLLIEAPYPMLIPDDDGAAPHLLVEAGKIGVPPARLGATPRRVVARGYTLARPDPTARGTTLRMIELLPDSSALQDAPAQTQPTNATLLGPVPTPIPTANTITIRGEILDSKCYLGAMKPGDGRAHRSCAQLCIQGGIPPMLRGRDHTGTTRLLLLLDHTAGTANQLAAPHAGLRVAVTGQLATIAGTDALLVTRIDHR